MQPHFRPKNDKRFFGVFFSLSLICCCYVCESATFMCQTRSLGRVPKESKHICKGNKINQQQQQQHSFTSHHIRNASKLLNRTHIACMYCVYMYIDGIASGAHQRNIPFRFMHTSVKSNLSFVKCNSGCYFLFPFLLLFYFWFCCVLCFFEIY